MMKPGAEQSADAHRPSELLGTLQAPRLRRGGRRARQLARRDSSAHRARAQPCRLVRATHEEEALAIACGARLGGARTAMFVQNAGLLSMGAGMVTLAQRYQFPLLMLVSYRGTAEDPVFYHVPKGTGDRARPASGFALASRQSRSQPADRPASRSGGDLRRGSIEPIRAPAVAGGRPVVKRRAAEQS
jgi:hypothetical protein